MAEIQYLWMDPDEVTRVGEIDRSEKIRTGYSYSEVGLQQMDVYWDAPSWATEGRGSHTVAAQVSFCRDHLNRNGQMYGAFDYQKLIGVGIIQPEAAKDTAQLAYLHVSHGYRRLGIGGRIVEALIDEAKKGGARILYVSATPSESAVSFYLSHGFKPTGAPIPELFELEPDDIHMVREISADR